MTARSVLGGFAALLVAAGLVFGACGDDDSAVVKHPNGKASTSPSDDSVTSNSSVAPNTFLTFEGGRYRLESLEQANLAVASDEYEKVGSATEADIDQTDLTVYRRDGENEAVYTHAAAQGAGEEATPALWYRWVLEP